MPTSHAPDNETFHEGPFNLINDGEAVNFASLMKDAGAAAGLIAKALDNAAAAYQSSMSGTVVCDGASGITQTGTGYTASIVAAGSTNGVQILFDESGPFVNSLLFSAIAIPDTQNSTEEAIVAEQWSKFDSGGGTGVIFVFKSETATVGGDALTKFEAVDVDATALTFDFIIHRHRP